MYVHRIKAGENNQYQSALLRESYRVGDKIKNRTLANLSKLPPETVDLIDGHLKGKQYTDINEALPNPIRSLAHGATMAIGVAMKTLGFHKLVHYRNTRERKLVIAMITGCLLRPHHSKSGLARVLPDTTLMAELGIDDATEDDLYAAMDWLADRQRAIEKRLVKRWLGTGSRVFYDMTSVWMEGTHCPLAEYGTSRDGKRGKKQVNFGLLCDDRGRPVSLSVHSGNITDPETMLALVVTREGLPVGYGVFPGATWEGNSFLPVHKQMVDRWPGISPIHVCDAGMLSHATMSALEDEGGRFIIGARLHTLPKALQETVLKTERYRSLTGDEVKIGVFRHKGRRLVVTWSRKRARKDASDRERAIRTLIKRLGTSGNARHLLRKRGTHRYIRIEGKARLVVDEARVEEASRWDGLKGVVTNLRGVSAAEILSRYRDLWKIDNSLKIYLHRLISGFWRPVPMLPHGFRSFSL